MPRRGILAARAVVAVVGLCGLVTAAPAQPTADQILTDAGLGPEAKERVLTGQFVDVSLGGVSARGLSFATAFLVKRSPEAISRQIVAGELITSDAQVQASGALTSAGSLADFAQLSITSGEARALTGAQPGDALNLSASEIAAFRALAGASTQSVQEQLHRMLLARYHAYRASGLGGIAPYDRGNGRSSDPAADLRKASLAMPRLQKYMPAFQKILLDDPGATLPEMQQSFFWLKSLVEGKTTYILTHVLTAPSGTARAVARREYYVSTGYDAEQSVAGFLPVEGGAVVVVASHAFTDQITGFGGSMKRSIGSRMMGTKLREIYEVGRDRAERQ
jgi:hypothetical protein